MVLHGDAALTPNTVRFSDTPANDNLAGITKRLSAKFTLRNLVKLQTIGIAHASVMAPILLGVYGTAVVPDMEKGRLTMTSTINPQAPPRPARAATSAGSVLAGSVLGGAALLALSATPSLAVLQIAANINGVLFNCVDNAACDTNSATGVLNVGSLDLGGVTISGTFQRQTIATAPGGQNLLNTNSFDIINNNATTVPITIAVGGTDFQGPVATYAASGTTNFTDANGSEFLLSYYGDINNTQGADTPGDTPGVLLTTSGLEQVTTNDPQAFALNRTGAFVDPNLFSFTLFATADLTAGGTLQNRTQAITANRLAVPVAEPGSLAALGTGLVGMVGALFGWRRRRDTAA
jgi:hypothetical protein